MGSLKLSRHTRILASVLLIAFLTVMWGGYYLTRVVTGDVEATEFQLAFARAGHAHASVLLTLGLVGAILADATRLTGLAGYAARHCVPIGALLMAVGFFVSSAGEGATEPNGLIVLVWIGAVSLGIGVVTLAVGLFRSATPAAAADETQGKHAGVG